MSDRNGTATRPSFFASEDTEVFNLDDQYWVELKRELDYGEENQLEGAAIRADVGLGSGQATPTLKYDLGNQRELMLALYIVDWNIPGHDGKTLRLPDSVTQKQRLLRSLSPTVARRIAGRIEAIRAEASMPAVIDLTETDDAAADPTPPGGVSEHETPSSSASGGEALATATSSERPSASSGRRSR